MFPPPPESVAWLGRTLVGVVAVGGPADCLPAGGLHGEGMLPIPEKVVKKILELAFVDGRPHADEGSLSVEERFNTLADGSGITDVGQWVQCFAGLVSVLSTKYPQAVPELMAYMATIVKCSRDYHGVAWAQYDRGFRKQMATLRDLRWSRINPTLFSLCFSGKAKRNTMCNWCLAESPTHAPESGE